jgi:hypothetical protein
VTKTADGTQKAALTKSLDNRQGPPATTTGDPCFEGGSRFACAELPVPGGGMPRVEASWEGSPVANVSVTVRAADLPLAEQVAVHVMAARPGGGSDSLYDATVGPDTKGNEDYSFKVPVDKTVTKVCVWVARVKPPSTTNDSPPPFQPCPPAGSASETGWASLT